MRGVKVCCWFSEGKSKFFGLSLVHVAFGLRQGIPRAIGAETCPMMDSFDTPLHPFTWSEGKKVKNLLQFCGFALSVYKSL